MRRGLDAALAIGLGLVAFATRWALRGHSLYSWDSGLLASGIVDYDFATGHPHPPYYPLAIAFGKAVAWATGPIDALIVLAVASAGVMAAFTYLAARPLVGPTGSVLASVLVILSPTALFNGIAPLTYSLEGAMSAVVAWAAWRSHRFGTRRAAIVLAVATSIAVGVRPSSVFLVTPLALWGVWRHRSALPWAIAAGAAASLAWGIPALVAGGGPKAFLAGTSYQSHWYVFAHTVVQSGWGVVPVYAARLASEVPSEGPLVAAVLALAAITALAWIRRTGVGEAAGFLAAWTLPPVLFFVFVYDGWPVYPSGYVLVLVPAVAVLLAWLLESMLLALGSSGAPTAFRVASSGLIVATLLLPMTWPAAWPEAVAGQREADDWSAILPSLAAEYPANETALVTFYAWSWIKFELPDHLAWGVQAYFNETGALRWQVVEGQHGRESPPLYANAMDGPDDPLHPIPAGIRHIVEVYAPPSRGVAEVLKPGLAIEHRTLPSGLQVSVLDATGLATIEEALVHFDAAGRPLPD